MAYDLKGKVIIVTGGASGIGFSCVEEVLRNGAQGVTIADANSVKGEKAVKILTEEFGDNRVIFAKIDAVKSSQLEAAFKVTLDFWKTINVVINNAAILNDNQWEREIALNCKGVVQGTLLGLQYMGKDQGGKGGIIINMASILGLQPFSCMPIYAGTKHFVMGFSRSVADSYHYNRTGVKILTICPALTETNLNNDLARRPLNFCSDMGRYLQEEVENKYIQSAKNVAEGVASLIAKGENGSVWLVENDAPIYEVEIPHWSTFDVL